MCDGARTFVASLEMPCLHNSEDQISSRSAQQVSAVCFQNSLSQKIRPHSFFKVYLIKKQLLDTILICNVNLLTLQNIILNLVNLSNNMGLTKNKAV